MIPSYYWRGTGFDYPAYVYGAGFAPVGCASGLQSGGWPFPGPYRLPVAPHRLAYPAEYSSPMHDVDIRRMVEKYLRSDPRLSSEAAIAIDVSNGVVTLTGMVPDKLTKYLVGDDCFNIPAVLDVFNNLRISELQKGGGER